MPAVLAPTNRSLVSEQLWDRLVARIIKDHDVDSERAERIMDAALGFLKLCGDHPGHAFAPSKLVDIGWHTFLMYTRGYRQFCEEHAGRFIHHEPNDVPDRPMTSGGSRTTVEFMLANNISFDHEIWAVSSHDCDAQPQGCTCDAEDCSGDDDCSGGEECHAEECSGGE